MGSYDDHCHTLQCFLHKLGDDATRALAVIQALRECKYLQVLDLCLLIDVIIGVQDRTAIEDFFLRGQPFDSPSMNDLVATLHSFPRLQSMRLHMAPDHPEDKTRNITVGHRVTKDFLHLVRVAWTLGSSTHSVVYATALALRTWLVILASWPTWRVMRRQ
jgi:hypothetical protein